MPTAQRFLKVNVHEVQEGEVRGIACRSPAGWRRASLSLLYSFSPSHLPPTQNLSKSQVT